MRFHGVHRKSEKPEYAYYEKHEKAHVEKIHEPVRKGIKPTSFKPSRREIINQRYEKLDEQDTDKYAAQPYFERRTDQKINKKYDKDSKTRYGETKIPHNYLLSRVISRKKIPS